MSDLNVHVVIIGAGHAGGTLAALLRQYGHEGPITLVGDEPIPPYQRPPLSKAWLKGAADAEALKTQVGPGKRLAVVGGGYIGLEVAASGRALGAEVVVLERETRLLARVACEVLSTFFRQVHEQHDVSFELGANVVGFE